MKTSLALAALALSLAGCVNFGDQPDSPAPTYYVLDDATPAAAAAARKADAPVLLVLDTTAGGFYDADQLVFSREAGTRGQYQFARWTERPGKRFADLLRARLDRQGHWRVANAGGYVRGDFMLDTELVEFYHDATSVPGTLRLELRVELVDLKQRSLVGRHVFEQRVALTSYDAAGAAAAANQAVARVLDDLSAWLASPR
ncbi:MAG: ABC-type transport auxiliary lipoprotein family protein [Thiobacillus sp.]|nr:ABC-type transport auxiliary lipoprotein family protein [Thiobacillus sp.]